MVKDFISADTVRDSALKMAWKMYNDGFVPTVVYASMRGGAYLANVFSEFFKVVCKRDGLKPAHFAAVVCSSREALIPGEDVAIKVDGWTLSPDCLSKEDKILIADDIFDTGNTVNVLVKSITDCGIPRENIKVAVYDYKIALYKNKKMLPVQPDYYARKHVLESEADETWIHYLAHEYVGLKQDEIEQEFSDSEVVDILKKISS